MPQIAMVLVEELVYELPWGDLDGDEQMDIVVSRVAKMVLVTAEGA